MHKLFNVTYQTYTPDEADEYGFVTATGEHVNMEGIWGAEAGKVKAENAMRLSEALNLIGLVDESGNGASFYEVDERENYRTGARTHYAMHVVDSVTPSSYARLVRVMQKQGYFPSNMSAVSYNL